MRIPKESYHLPLTREASFYAGFLPHKKTEGEKKRG